MTDTPGFEEQGKAFLDEDIDDVPYPLTVRALEVLDRAGIFLKSPGKGRLVELLDGRLIQMSPPTAAHGNAQAAMFRVLFGLLDKTSLSETYGVMSATVTLNDKNAPVPDALVYKRGELSYYVGTEIVVLVIEVAVSSRRKDLGIKRIKYATSEIPDYWVVDTKSRQVSVFRKPSDADYAEHTILVSGDRISPLFAEGRAGHRGSGVVLSLSPLPDLLIRPVVDAALAEDLGRAGDVTAALLDADARLTAVFAARKPGRVAGLACARLAVHALDPQARFDIQVHDGEDVAAGAVLARVKGNARALLSAERTALNLLGRLSGVATLTRAYVQAVAGTGAVVVDTRKTTPGLRALEKYAVRCGGGVNHRFGLDDAILIKDNHVAACGGVGEALRRARAAAGHLTPIEVEVDGLDQLDAVLADPPTVVMLDNFSLADLREAVRRTAGRVRLEASGGVTLDTVRAIAETGVDAISVGALTHSAPVLDIGLDAV